MTRISSSLNPSLPSKSILQSQTHLFGKRQHCRVHPLEILKQNSDQNE